MKRVKTRAFFLLTNFATMAATMMVVQIAGPAQAERDAEYYRQRDELIAAEKELLRAEDQVSYQIFDLKRTIDQMFKRLSALQSRQDSIRHQLITVKMKLMD